MTYTQPQIQTFEELLNYDDGSDRRYELMVNGDLRELPPESEENDYLATSLYEALKQVVSRRLIKTHSTTIQVTPYGDKSVNRYPDLVVLRPEHITLMAEAKKNAIAFGMPAPQFIAEIVSPGSEKSENYQRDYVWKRYQYQSWGVPEYWIVDPQRQRVTVLTLEDSVYVEAVYQSSGSGSRIQSVQFPQLITTVLGVVSP